MRWHGFVGSRDGAGYASTMNPRAWFHASTAAASAAALCIGALACLAVASAQPTSTSPLAPPPNGPRRLDPAGGLLVFTNATVHVKPGTTLTGATLVIRNGQIAEVLEKPAEGTKSTPYVPPPNARIEPADALHFYPGFIDCFVEVDAPRPDPNAETSHWNPRITPQRSALDRGASGIDDPTASTLRAMGFVAAAIAPRSGLMRGSGAVVALSRPSPDPSDAKSPVLAHLAFHTLGFADGGGFDGDRRDDARWIRYPDSQMGAIALIRQTLLDADWQSRTRELGSLKGPPNALDALDAKSKIPLLWDTSNELESLRALRISKEFERPAFILGSGREYRRIAALKAFKPQLIVPLVFPTRPSVASFGELESTELSEMIAWEQAPTNLRRLNDAGFTLCLTTSKVPDKLGGRASFSANLAQSIKHGLLADHALAMLTTNPAALLGLSARLGTIEKGKNASFIVADGPLFVDRPDAPGEKDPGYLKPGKILDVYIDGLRHRISPEVNTSLVGEWKIVVDAADAHKPQAMSLHVSAKGEVSITREFKDADTPMRATAKARDVVIEPDGKFRFVFDSDAFGSPPAAVFVTSGTIERGEGTTRTLHAVSTRAGARPGDNLADSFAWTGLPVPATSSAPDVPVKPESASFRPTPESLAGQWTLVLNGAQAKPSDPQHPSVTLGADKSVTVRRANEELKVTDVTFDTSIQGPLTIVKTIRYTVHALTPDQPSARIALTPTADSARLSGSTAPDDAETFQLARYRPTPETDDIKSIPEVLGLPVGPYALNDMPEQGSVLISNATIWTSGPAGILEKAFIAFQAGKITFVGSLAPALQGEWTTIDATGKHVTPGIIDCHSHTGISKGVNESGQAVTAEVRIGDVTDPDSISWYRQLAGGVTCVNSLHGSANPIGGQNQVNKVRWGAVDPNDMHYQGAIPGIKFALGENVKQSNWGDNRTTRYPQTRMGVESLIRDRFTAAREYARSWAIYLAFAGQGEARSLPESFVSVLKGYSVLADDTTNTPARPRRDLELEALAEIVAGTRLVHCHSYRQDEILMLTRIARDFRFKIGTFQHILEGYKVADELKEWAIGASAFSDWWNYKVEVQDAIPYAGPIMNEVGVVVSYNSDSDELARRLNVEAGKAVKYGGPTMSPAEAFKFVTINPAKQLKIDAETGSLEVGKVADIVLWSGPPMSPTTRAEVTWVDGRRMFSLERDAELRTHIAAERERLAQKILNQIKRETGAPAPSRAPIADKVSATKADPLTPPQFEADALTDARSLGRRLLLSALLDQGEDARRELFLDMLKRGLDPRWSRKGECGCGL